MRYKNNDEHKENILKLTIIVSFLWLIITTVSVSLHELFPKDHPKYNLYIIITIVICIVMVILTVLLCVLMCTSKITYSKVKFKQYKIKYSSYKKTKEELLKELLCNGFSSYLPLFNSDFLENNISVKKRIGSIIIFQLIKVKEIDEKIIEETTNSFWNYVCTLNMQSEDVMLIQCICVDKITKTFSKFIEQNVPQQFERYQLPVGISFGCNKIYIATQKGGFFKSKYNFLKKLFLKIIKNIIVKTE